VGWCPWPAVVGVQSGTVQQVGVHGVHSLHCSTWSSLHCAHRMVLFVIHRPGKSTVRLFQHDVPRLPFLVVVVVAVVAVGIVVVGIVVVD
jgi:hypothetical protein